MFGNSITALKLRFEACEIIQKGSTLLKNKVFSTFRLFIQFVMALWIFTFNDRNSRERFRNGFNRGSLGPKNSLIECKKDEKSSKY
jgi:hypothetical protein